MSCSCTWEQFLINLFGYRFLLARQVVLAVWCLPLEQGLDWHFWSPLQDEQSAVSMLKKHQILEQAVEDYAETVHQLSKTSRTLVADNHPERY